MAHRQLTTYQVVIAQTRAFRAIKGFMAQVLDRHDLTVTEWLIIGMVIDSGPDGVRISGLAQTLGVEMPVVTNLLHKAESAKWVMRIQDTQDKRAWRIIATQVGLERACDIEGELQEGTKTWLSGLDAKNLEGYLAVVGTLATKE